MKKIAAGCKEMVALIIMGVCITLSFNLNPIAGFFMAASATGCVAYTLSK